MPHVGQYPILFVTQVPVSAFDSGSSAFANHLAGIESLPRGGDLYLRYPDGKLRNLTREAGFGMEGQQGANAIAVREPEVHWDGKKALFSMVVGAPGKQYEVDTYNWQIYEVTGLGDGEKAVITKLANQPAEYNNVSPSYGTDDRVLFTSDRPRDGSAHLYPQLDEYESRPTVTGIWSLDPASGDLFLLNHTASGVFSPRIDSFGRVIFTKWDHLQRDQQADADKFDHGGYGSFNFAGETASAAKTGSTAEVYPEPRDTRDPELPANVSAHSFNQFFPWQINEDGSAEETVNHVGRHEFGGAYTDGSFKDDPNLTYLYASPETNHQNRFYVASEGGFFQIREDPAHPGTYFATNSKEFSSDASGGILKFDGSPSLDAEEMVVTPVTAGITRELTDEGKPAEPAHSGHYRNALPMEDGTLVASHTAETRADKNDGTRDHPQYRYAFRLTKLKQSGSVWVPDAPLTEGIEKSLTYYDPDVLVTFNGPLWELDPVEVRPHARPIHRVEPLEAPEAQVLMDEGVDEAKLRAWLSDKQLSLIVSRDVTRRDRSDLQQPYNLQVPGGVKTVGKPGKVYDVAYLQLFQADQVRGYGDRPGRRVLAEPVHDVPAIGLQIDGQPKASTVVAKDGSTATLVPSRRAMTWQLVAPDGSPVVRERNWVSFAPGEIRACPVCHGLNTQDQAGGQTPQNPPEALRSFLKAWKTLP